MDESYIEEFTRILISKEKFFSYYIWKIASNYRITLGKEEVEDIFSEAYLTAVTKIRNNRNLKIQYPLAWFTKLVFLTLMNSLRKKFKKGKVINVEEIRDLLTTNSVYETMDMHMDDPLLQEVIKKNLTDEEKTVLQMNVDGYSYEEIGDRLGKTKDAVRQVKSRAVRKLKKVLN